MEISYGAFIDELSKIAGVQREDATKERMLRALKAGLVAGGGYGLGMGAGHLLSSTVLPRTLQRYVPNPTAKQLAIGSLVAGGLGSAANLARQAMLARGMRYVREEDKKPRDMLMGHEKLNPPAEVQQ